MTQGAFAIVIAGATGNLAKLKLVPALQKLFNQNRLGPDPLVIGTGRGAISDEEFRNRFDLSARFAAKLFYHRNISGIGQYLKNRGSFRRVIFFLSLPPAAYSDTARQIAAEGFGANASIIIEKPFGYDLASARKLNAELAQFFDESQIFRIDHYLAKEAVQNMLVFRFANSIFEPVWNGRFIESIQINALEERLVEDRCEYFDGAGIIRDMVQNHLLQLLCLLTMEPALSLGSDDVRNRKTDILRVLSIDKFYRFQYRNYCNTNGIHPKSKTETFAELQLSITNPRWIGVPVLIRCGKAAHRTGTEIGVRFKPLPPILYNSNGSLEPNCIIFKIQPTEGIVLDIQSRIPGSDNGITRSSMNFCMRDSFSGDIPEAYQRLIHDALRGDSTHFVSARELEIAWSVVSPALEQCDGNEFPELYEPGTLPESRLTAKWIDFDKYCAVCSR